MLIDENPWSARRILYVEMMKWLALMACIALIPLYLGYTCIFYSIALSLSDSVSPLR